MTPVQLQQQAREAAQRDISDIDLLAKNEPFNRYWVGRLNSLFNKERENSLTESTVDLREIARIRAKLLRELTQMPAMDRQSCEKFLSTPLPTERRPQQVG